MIVKQLLNKNVLFFTNKISAGKNNKLFNKTVLPLRSLTIMKSTNLTSLATSYATALIDLSQEKNVLEEVHTDMDTLQHVLKKDQGLSNFFGNPMISEDKKCAVLDKIAGQANFSVFTTNFLKLLVERGRMEAIEEIFEQFDLEYCKLTDTQVAILRSVVKLEADQQMSLAHKIKELSGSKNIRLIPMIDESLIGGFVIEYGSSRIDLSVKGHLERIGNELLASAGTQD
eukprot:TRINITY_DN6380_c0_g1_i4.p1 TRINITY_DN6380_c0_g1~~TRINITY_DN6380_c0_g1_i4.p1  ORF type:complete len:229 (-),score=29.70 TRINITY_DN6380_c0_g1_i4:320-1006(-)